MVTIWERTRHCPRMRHALGQYFPAALAAFDDLDAADALELLGKAPDPVSAARLTLAQISAALKRARRRNIPEKAARIQPALRTGHLTQPDLVAAAFAATVASTVAVLRVLNEQIAVMHQQVQAQFAQHPAAAIVESQPGLGPIPGARVLGEFGDASRAAGARWRRTGCGTSIRLCPGRWGSGRSARPAFRPHRHGVDAAARPVQQVRLGQLVEDQSAQPVPHAGVLPFAQPPPRGVPGPTAQLRREVPPPAAGIEHEQDPFQSGPVVDPRSPTRTTRYWPGRDQRFDQFSEPILDPLMLHVPRYNRRRSTISSSRSRSDTPSSETRS